MVGNMITILFLFTKSDIKGIVIPVVSAYYDAPWFCSSAENYYVSTLDSLCCPFTTQH